MIIKKTSRNRIVLYAGRTILVLWAGFWTWFVIGHFFTEGFGCLPYALGFWVPFAILTVIGWRWSRIGGATFVAAGGAATAYFGFNATLVLPAIILGSLMILFGRKTF